MFNDYIIKFNIKQIRNFFNEKENITMIDYEYNNNKYVFNLLKYLYIDIYYCIIDDDCIAIVINNEKLSANINIINGYLPLTNIHIINEKLFSLGLDFIRNKENIKVVTIEDVSFINYKLYNINIKSSLLSILTTGHTWYGKYNFRPVNTLNEIIIDDNYNKIYNKNNKIMNKLTIENVKDILLKYFNDKVIIKIINENSNMLVKNFISFFLDQYDVNIVYFEKFYYNLFIDIGLDDYIGETYGLFL
jgi:hypothetical protein